MIKKIENMWHQLYQWKVVKLTKLTQKQGILEFSYITNHDQSFQYETVIIGFNRVMLLYEDMLKYYHTDELRVELLGQSAFILLITTLEAYLSGIFHNLSDLYQVQDIEKEIFDKFLKKFNIKISYNYEEIKEIKISNFLPERLNFQDKDYCKKAFALFSLNIAKLDLPLWNKIYGNSKCYMQLRHEFIHKGPEYGLYKNNRIDIENFEIMMLEIAQFLCQIDNYFYRILESNFKN